MDVNDDAEDILHEANLAIEYVQALHDELEPEATYDEFEAVLDLTDVTMQGNIDHLVVTHDAYYLVDYKTDRHDPTTYDSVEAFVEERRRHHEPQIRAYAAALQEADPSREVHARLFFTDVATTDLEAAVATWNPADLADARVATERLLERHRPAETL